MSARSSWFAGCGSVASARRWCRRAATASGCCAPREILNLFDARVDGVVASELGLPGKPAPDMFLKAADMLSARPARAVVVEDAISGVEAGRAGGFGLVLGVDREGHGDALRAHGADIVVTDLRPELLDA